jgi:cation diffusion facilitator CzcD-associated flavoprotein CzcO
MREHHDTVVIGGGQTGLAMSRCWKREREHVVLERRRVGERWRTERGTLFVSVPQLGSGGVVVARRMSWVTAAAAASEASGSHMS